MSCRTHQNKPSRPLLSCWLESYQQLWRAAGPWLLAPWSQMALEVTQGSSWNLGGRFCFSLQCSESSLRRNVTEETVYFIGTTKRQMHKHYQVTYTMYKSNCPRSQHQPSAPLQVHDGEVVEWLADGHITVICHYYQQHHLSCSNTMGKEDLGHASCKGNGLVFSEKVCNHLRSSDWGKPHINKGQVGQQEVHGRMQMGVSGD